MWRCPLTLIQWQLLQCFLIFSTALLFVSTVLWDLFCGAFPSHMFLATSIFSTLWLQLSFCVSLVLSACFFSSEFSLVWIFPSLLTLPLSAYSAHCPARPPLTPALSLQTAVHRPLSGLRAGANQMSFIPKAQTFHGLRSCKHNVAEIINLKQIISLKTALLSLMGIKTRLLWHTTGFNVGDLPPSRTISVGDASWP